MNSDFLDRSKRNNLCFFGYRIPGELPRFGAARHHDCIRGLAEGFVIKPFLPSADTITIPFTQYEATSDSCISTDSNVFPDYDTARSYYLKHAGIIINYLKEHPDEKVVYSRVKKMLFRQSLSQVFDTLCKLYSSAYVFCFHTPWTGTWLGASPELLALCHRDTFATAALAGTMNAHKGGPWSTKNKLEQQVVADFIRQTLRHSGIAKIHETHGERKAGPVKHLITEFSASVPDHIKADELAVLLSPTPALAGFPRDSALELIEEHESHKRGCYGGFCGPRFNNDDFHFWVTLRCIQIKNTECAFYVGGGLMADSTPENEWEETEIKRTTLEAALSC